MKSLFLFIALALLGKVNATNYYFSSSTGDDSRTAVQAQNPATPWKTLNKLNAFFINLKPGDSVLLKRGDVFYGTITATVNGSKSNPIIIGSYGTGVLPTIVALNPTTIWSDPINGVYSTTLPVNYSSTNTIVWEDDVPILKFATTAACINGKIYGNGKTFYYKPSTGKASNHKIIIETSLWAFTHVAIDLSDRSYITVENVAFKSSSAGIKTFDIAGGTEGLTIKNCSFSYCHSAILLMPDKNNNRSTTIENCYFYRNQNAARMYTTEALGNRPGQTHGTNIACKILNNEMAENGTIDGKTEWVYGSDKEAIGLQHFVNGVISGNYIHGGSQIGIGIYNLTTRSSDNNLIKNNFITTNKRTAIEFNGDDAQSGGAANYAFNNNTIANNIIINAGGTLGGVVIVYPGANTSRTNYFINNTLSGKSNILDIKTSRQPYLSVKNNIFYNPGDVRLVAFGFTSKPATLEMDYNIYFEKNQTSYGWQLSGPGKNHTQMKSLGLELHSKIINPLFINEASNNFRLQPFSPAIDAGTYVGLPYTGVAPDMGAYEMEFQTLPLQFVSFKGKKAGKAIELQWQTANESNTDYFEVLKSTDGQHFEVIGRLAANNKPLNSVYALIDIKPFSGKNYYQIKQVDKDGKYTFSEIVIVSYSNVVSMQVSPNPATDKITISLNTAQPFKNATLLIRSLAGNSIKNIPVGFFSESIPVDVSTLSKGTYIVSLLYDNTTLNQKFIKQ